MLPSLAHRDPGHNQRAHQLHHGRGDGGAAAASVPTYWQGQGTERAGAEAGAGGGGSVTSTGISRLCYWSDLALCGACLW